MLCHYAKKTTASRKTRKVERIHGFLSLTIGSFLTRSNTRFFLSRKIKSFKLETFSLMIFQCSQSVITYENFDFFAACLQEV